MKIKPKKIFNTIIFVLFTLYISFYIASVSGYYEYEKKEADGLKPGPMISPNPHARFFFVKDPNGVDIQFVQED